MNLQETILGTLSKAFKEIYNVELGAEVFNLQYTREGIKGDFTLNVFPLLRFTKKSVDESTQELGEYVKANLGFVADFNIIKGFLNFEIEQNYWLKFANLEGDNDNYGYVESNTDSENIVIEYSSPNTNKPLHLGHIRNNLLGFSVAEIVKASGKNVVKVNLVNDRGIHICKSMLAWQKWGNGATPESENKKGDKLVGDYYVLFDKKYKEEIAELVNTGMSEDVAKKSTKLLAEAQEMLRKWESGDNDTVSLWKTMNEWVYKGFDETYKKLGVDFDKIYYESETYKLGKSIVLKGLDDDVLEKQEDESIWADLTEDGLDKKILLRSDGTSVYMTQDIGTAHQRFNEFDISKHVYVVGNEQNYHFQVLKLVLKKLGHNWADDIFHLSYGMVELPEGKMKSREGTVVDADDLIAEMINTAREKSEELGKLEDYSNEEKEKVYKTIAMGALKYFILKVDPKKSMMFNPNESIDFNGNTGPFIQYTYARINSILRKANSQNINTLENFNESINLSDKESNILKSIYRFPEIIQEAAAAYSPALISTYIYNLVKEYNQFYHDFYILGEENQDLKMFRLRLSKLTANTIKSAMQLLGIDVPERM